MKTKINRFGDHIRTLRNDKGLLLRQMAAHLETDTAFVSKLERGEKKATREQVLKLAQFLKVDKEELLMFWLADRISEVISGEPLGKNALNLVLNNCKK